MVAGWSPEDEATIVVPTGLVSSDDEVELGQEMTLRIAGQDSRMAGCWRPRSIPTAHCATTVYVNQAYFERQIGELRPYRSDPPSR